MNTYDWLDRHIEEQREQAELLNRISAPFTAAELCEQIDELEEIGGYSE